MAGCGVDENCLNSSNVKTQNDKQQQVSISPGKSAPSSTPLKRKAALSPTFRVMAQGSSRKLRKIDEDSIVSLTDVPEKAELTVKDLDNNIKHLFPGRRVLQLVSTRETQKRPSTLI